MPRRHRADKRRAITAEQFADLWLGPTCYRDHKMFGGVWCECSPFASPLEREEAYWALPEDRRRLTHARYTYDDDARAATETAERDGRDPTVVEIERGLLTRSELAGILKTGAAAELSDRPEPVLVERAGAARKALKRGRHVE